MWFFQAKSDKDEAFRDVKPCLKTFYDHTDVRPSCTAGRFLVRFAGIVCTETPSAVGAVAIQVVNDIDFHPFEPILVSGSKVGAMC